MCGPSRWLPLPDALFGTGVRTDVFGAGDRPITATVPKPKVGLSTEQHARIARLCGVDWIHTGTVGSGRLANEDAVGVNEWLYADLRGLWDEHRRPRPP